MPSKNRLRLEGDHSSYHAGSAAVFAALRCIAVGKGWQIVEPGAEYDVMVMNGEGTMHHGWEAAHKKASIMRDALSAGKPVHLVNTVWQENPSDFDDFLHSLASITVRETRSRDDLRKRHGIEARVVPDVSMYAPLKWVFFRRNFRRGAALTDFYWRRDSTFSRADDMFPGARLLRFKKFPWSHAVASLRTASYLITGRQHGVYAACKARIPFAASEGNTHKIRGLIESAGAAIPVADTPDGIHDIIPMLPDLRGEFEKLFDWLDRQDYPSIIPDAPPPSGS